MTQVVTDEYLATALRQAANKLDKQRAEIASLKAYTYPSMEKITVHDFITLLRKADTNEQLSKIMKLVEEIHRTDGNLILEEDWVLLTSVVMSNKKGVLMDDNR